MLNLSAFTGTGGLSGSSSASSDSGPVSVGGFTFAPKSSTLPTAAWVAVAALGAVLVLALYKR
jgi:hypothetical protein